MFTICQALFQGLLSILSYLIFTIIMGNREQFFSISSMRKWHEYVKSLSQCHTACQHRSQDFNPCSLSGFKYYSLHSTWGLKIILASLGCCMRTEKIVRFLIKNSFLSLSSCIIKNLKIQLLEILF